MDTRDLVRVALAGAFGAILFGGVLGAGALRLDAAGAVAVLSLATLGGALVADAERLRARLHLLGGALASGVFALDLRVWIGVVWVSAVAMALAPAGRRPRDLLLFAASAFTLPLLFFAAAAATGNAPVLAKDLLRALPVRPLASAAVLALETVVVLVAAGLADVRHLARLCVVAAAIALAARVAWIALLSTLPTELYWSESPFLVNALKLDAHVPLYGPPELLDSYTYSPLMDLLHHALLAPIGAELSLHASRVVVLVEQAAAAFVLYASLGANLTPRYGRALPALLLSLAVLGNPLAPAVHPDHALLLCFAVAVSLLAAEARWPRPAFWAALVLLPPVAVGFKLSGAGLGVGLFAAFLLERRFREVAALAASGALAVATVPLFDATLGRFSFYAVRVQASHPILWPRLWELLLTPAGAAGLFAIAFGAYASRAAAAPLPAVRRVATLTAATFAASLPAYVKYAGRENNVALLVVGAVIVILLSGARLDAPRRLFLAPFAALLFAVLYEPKVTREIFAERGAAIADDARVLDTLAADAAAGRRTLVLVSTSAWIRAGRREVPHDRFHSAIELFFGGFPEAGVFFSHIEDGRYDTVIATSAELRAGTDPLGRFDERLEESLRGYAIVWPEDGHAADGVVIFRRVAYAD